MVTSVISPAYSPEQFNRFIASLKYPPNKFQLKVLESIAFGSGNITVDAKAGSGKTSLLKMIASLLLDMGVEPSEVIFQAFNKSIEEELNAQLPKGFTAKTSHSLGLAMCREYAAANGIKLGKLSDKKYKDIANYIAERIHPSAEEQEKRFKAMQTVSKLVNFIMANDVDPNDAQAVEELAYHYALEITPAMVTWMPYAIEQAIERFKKFGELDFIDMIYMPVKLKMEPKFRYRYVLVDEAQDLNSLQQEISAKLLHPEGRVIVVGDPNQSIYAFSGADSQAFYNLNTRFNTQVLELNTCYRCPTSHIELAQSLVPSIEAAPNAIKGEIKFNHLDSIASMPLGSMVICRLNAPLFASYFQFIAAEKPAVIIGRDMGKGLLALVEKIAEMEGFRYYSIANFIERYADMEEAKLEKKPNAASKIAQLNDQIACLNVCVDNFDCDDLECFKAKLEALFVDFKDKNLDKSKVVTLCTVHRAKGLEAEHIGLIYQRKSGDGTFNNIMPLTWEKQREWELEQEFNIKYVAFTRAKSILTLFGGYKPGDEPDLTAGNEMPLKLDLEFDDEDEDDFEIEPENKVYNYPGEALDEYEDDEEDEDMDELETLMAQPATLEEAAAPTLSLEAAADALYKPVQVADFTEEAAGTPITPRKGKGRCSYCKGTGVYQEAMCRACEGRGEALYELEDHDGALEKEIAEAMMGDPSWKTYVYGMSRPCMYGTCPNDFISLYEQPGGNGFYVDHAAYSRKLSREEMKRFEMQPVSASAWDVQIGDKVFTTGRIEYTVKEHLKNGKLLLEAEVDGRKENQIEHQWDVTPAKALANGLDPKPLSLGDLVLLNPDLPTDKGWHNRAVKVATMLQDAGLWDGKSFIRFDNAYEAHKRVVGFEHLDLNKLILTQNDGELFVSLPVENSPSGEKLTEDDGYWVELGTQKVIVASVQDSMAYQMAAGPFGSQEAAEAYIKSQIIPTEPVAWAKWMFENKERVVILDTETTDLPQNRNNFEIVQLSIINLDGEVLFNRYIMPRQSRITRDATNVHGITMQTLQTNGAMSLEPQYLEIAQILKGKIVIAYNAPFDKGALENSLKLNGFASCYEDSWHDAMRIYAKHNPSKLNRNGKSGTSWSLVEAVAQQGLAVDENAHDALADVRMTLELIKSMAADSPERWQTPKALPAPKTERPYQVNDLVKVKASGVIAEVKKIVGNEINIAAVEDGHRQTVSPGMIELVQKSEDRSKLSEETAAAESEEQTDAHLDVRHMDLKGKEVRLDDGTVAEVIEVKGSQLTVQPQGEAAPLEVSREDLFSVITTQLAEPEEATEPEIETVIVVSENPKQANPYAELERLMRSFKTREAALEFVEIIQTVLEEVYPENA